MSDRPNTILVVRRFEGDTYLFQATYMPLTGDWRVSCHGPQNYFEVRDTGNAWEEIQDMLQLAISTREKETIQ